MRKMVSIAMPLAWFVAILISGPSLASWSASDCNNGLASAFAPPHCLVPQHQASTTINDETSIAINHRTAIGTNNRIRNTVMHARNKNGGRKVPKMPTLPVSTTATIAEEDARADASSNYYSTSKPASASTMVVVDVENVRGATSFRISHEALLCRIRAWREDRLSMASTGQRRGDGASFLEPLVWICDHGAQPSIHHFSMLAESTNEDDDTPMPHNFGAIFAGPGRSADDVIVDLVGVRCGGGSCIESDDGDTISQPVKSSRNTTIVITADARLISRCQEARRRSSSLSDVIFVEPASLLQQLERHRSNAHEEEALFGEVPRLTKPAPISDRGAAIEERGKRRSDGKTSTMTSFKDSTIAMQQHAKFQARFQSKKKATNADAVGEEPSNNVDEEEFQSEPDATDFNSAALAAQLKTEQIRRQFLLSDAYYLARPSKNVRGRRAHTTQAAVHANYKNRNISKKQQKKLYAKRFGRKRKEDMVHAAVKRKELAAKLQSNLRCTKNCNSFGEEDMHFLEEGENGLLTRSMNLLETLLRRFEEERLIRGQSLASGDEIGPATSSDSATTFLGIESTSGRVGSDDKWDPLGSTVNVPLREGVQDRDQNLQPLRLVVISDTHGFEGALARFAEQKETTDDESLPDQHRKMHSDDFLLPQADVLLHCGDFAASGSRKTQRAAARRLDEFLARQTHISEKIVIQGNHDPDSPAKVIFPQSKALYVRSSSTLTINGVKVALEPFSRKMAFRSIRKRTSSYAMPSTFPECDILVSHEPPKGVLDLTYHGFSAGSLYLRELVEHAEHKPRLWLCGHIHESRGILTRQFQPDNVHNNDGNEDATDSTTVINASNANSGRANRIVSGAVVVDIERCTSINGGDETAESTLVAQKVDYVDGFVANGSDGSPPLAGLGEDLELYVTRPGVRRRKGVPRSVRQQMKSARASLVSSGSNDEE